MVAAQARGLAGRVAFGPDGHLAGAAQFLQDGGGVRRCAVINDLYCWRCHSHRRCGDDVGIYVFDL